jgi:cation transport ATPase
MSSDTRDKPRILHAIPGRIRVHLPHWSGQGQRHLEQRVRAVPGVRRAEANPTTGNILICFDSRQTNESALLSALDTAEEDAHALPEDKPLPPVMDEAGSGPLRQARIAVRGLDRDPQVVRKVVEQLRKLFGVRVRASLLTGRVLVEYDERHVDLHELLAHVAEVELPDLPGEDRPAHPLDTAPLLHAATRTIGATLGLGLIAARRLAGAVAPPGRVRTAATVAGVLGLLRSFPFIRNGLRRLLGTDAADLVFSTASIITLAFSGSPLGLTLTGLEGLFLLSEVMARRAAWRRHEDCLQGTAAVEPGAVIRLEAGQRVPLEAEVIEGSGTAIGRDGLPRRITPGTIVPAGADLSGGPFVLELRGGTPFVPQPRPAPPASDFYTRYLQILGPLSLGYAGLTGLLTLSVARTFEALLLVNPRTAIIGMEAANLGAAAQALRAGVTVVGTRPDRAIRLPDVLLLDGPRVLTDGLEISTVLPLVEELDAPEVLALAGSISTAAGSPWGNVFPRGGERGVANAPVPKATDASFNGLWIAGAVEGVRYTLGPPEDSPPIGEAVERRHQGGYLLLLSHEDGRALGLVALRPCPGERGGVSPPVLPGGERGSGSSPVPKAEGIAVASASHAEGGLEITTVLPLDEAVDAPEVLELAGEVCAAAGCRWSCAFPSTGNGSATDGTFNGLWATAVVQGVRYTLGPPEDPPPIGEAVERRHEGGYLLLLSREEDGQPLGLVGLRPRLSPGAARLVSTCRRLGVRVEMLPRGAPLAAQAVARRAAVPLVDAAESAALTAIQRRQQAGAFVAFVSDTAQAAPAFADCDLAIGLAPAWSGSFPARADLLAPDLEGVIAVLEAGAHRGRSVRDAVWFSAAANLFGALWGFRGRPGVERASSTASTSPPWSPWPMAGCGCGGGSGPGRRCRCWSIRAPSAGAGRVPPTSCAPWRPASTDSAAIRRHSGATPHRRQLLIRAS